MTNSQYDEIADIYPSSSLSMALLDYVYQALSYCFAKVYRYSPITTEAYISDTESLIDEETFFQMQR